MRALLRQVSAETALVEAFLALLDEEAAALTGSRFEALPGITRRKDEAAERLAAADAVREQLLQALGHAGDRAGAAAAAGGPALQQAWERLLALAARARDQNHRNGVMIHAHLDFTRQSIAFLQTGNRPLYGPDGQYRAPAGSSARYAAG
ncbi:flagellar protein FlgN [Ramlibacter tataouinensis]|uniref:flagella synthesis protein FlgN n=1 Tax=Ramlibacter tataouinensis TaxID=94132 RepID=UPI0022F3A4C8|nr:flagellar protein FlgN [Ramlibacter tataouinensis]WBY00587.1 flagellar protein FlgN [Ramlibacter tataouinensis]